MRATELQQALEADIFYESDYQVYVALFKCVISMKYNENGCIGTINRGLGLSYRGIILGEIKVILVTSIEEIYKCTFLKAIVKYM